MAGLGIRTPAVTLPSGRDQGHGYVSSRHQGHEVDGDADLALERVILRSSSRSLSDLRRAYDDALGTDLTNDGVILDINKRLASPNQSFKSQVPTGRLSGQLSPFKKQASMTEHLNRTSLEIKPCRNPSLIDIADRRTSQSPTKTSGLKRPLSMIELGRPPRPAPSWPLPALPPPHSASNKEAEPPHSASYKEAGSSGALGVRPADGGNEKDVNRSEDHITLCKRNFYDAAAAKHKSTLSTQIRVASSTLPHMETHLQEPATGQSNARLATTTPAGRRVRYAATDAGGGRAPPVKEVPRKRSFLSLNSLNRDRSDLPINSAALSQETDASLYKSATPNERDLQITGLNMLLDQDHVVGYGSIKGVLKVFTASRSRSFNPRIGAISLRLRGYEETLEKTNDRQRHTFYTHSQDVASKNVSHELENIDLEGFVSLHESGRTFPFDFRLREIEGMDLRPSLERSHGSIAYRLVASVKVKHPMSGSRDTIHTEHAVKVYPRLDSETVLQSLRMPIIAASSKTLFLGGSKEVALRVTMIRDTWIAGQKLHIGIDIINNASRKFNRLDVGLQEIIKMTEDIGSDSNYDDSKGHRELISETSLVKGGKAYDVDNQQQELWPGVLARTKCSLSRSLWVPLHAVTLDRIKRLSMHYCLQVSIYGSFGSKIQVEIPIRIVQPASLAPKQSALRRLPGQPMAAHSPRRARDESRVKSSMDLRSRPVSVSKREETDQLTERLMPACTEAHDAPTKGTKSPRAPLIPGPGLTIKNSVDVPRAIAPQDLGDLLSSPAFSEAFSMPSTSETGHSTVSDASDVELQTPALLSGPLEPYPQIHPSFPSSHERDRFSRSKPSHPNFLASSQSVPNLRKMHGRQRVQEANETTVGTGHTRFGVKTLLLGAIGAPTRRM